MKYVRSDQLLPGMVSLKSIYDQRGVCLLAANHVLTLPIIFQLRKQKYPGLYVYDEYSEFENLKQVFGEARRARAVKAMHALNIDQVIFFATSIVESILHMEDQLLDMAQLKENNHDIYEHSVNVAMVATVCGVGMGLSDLQLKELATTAMLHDIGKMAIPDEILNKPGKLTPEEMTLMRTHSEIGATMLCHVDAVNDEIRKSILMHHENYDGSGYPTGAKGKEIPLYARIIHVADVYDAMIQKRSYKQPFNPLEVIEYLMGNAGIMFDIEVIYSFLRYVVVYPVGTTVTLSDGRKARVVQNRLDMALRPVVVVLGSKEQLDLADDPSCYNLTIVAADCVFHEGDGLEPLGYGLSNGGVAG